MQGTKDEHMETDGWEEPGISGLRLSMAVPMNSLYFQ